MTPSVLQEIIASALQLHRPIHVWKTGVIIYDSIVAVMIGHAGKPIGLIYFQDMF